MHAVLHVNSWVFKFRHTLNQRKPGTFIPTKITRYTVYTHPDTLGLATCIIQLIPIPALGQSPYQVLRTGESVTLSLTLSNIGDNSTFRVDAVVRGNPSNIGETPSKFTHTLSGGSVSQSVSLANDETKSLGLIVTTTGEVTEADTLYLQITMTDESSSERSNYYNLQFTGTTVPPVDLSLVVRSCHLSNLIIHVLVSLYRSTIMEAEACRGV